MTTAFSHFLRSLHFTMKTRVKFFTPPTYLLGRRSLPGRMVRESLHHMLQGRDRMDEERMSLASEVVKPQPASLFSRSSTWLQALDCVKDTNRKPTILPKWKQMKSKGHERKAIQTQFGNILAEWEIGQTLLNVVSLGRSPMLFIYLVFC